MGRSCVRRSGALRVFDPGRRASRAELEHDSEKTGELSQRVRRISPGKDRPLRRARCAAVAAQRWNRAEPFENRSHNREREKLSRRAGRVRKFRRISVELCWGQANSELLADHV